VWKMVRPRLRALCIQLGPNSLGADEHVVFLGVFIARSQCAQVSTVLSESLCFFLAI
jgi:hypothetical protein